ncbi:hypothetical protein GOODEAATRI_000078 [Goodea atripinnis]|uniref:Ig-like domain-containing protein n=1 Tax=Goodea atripinnis TaxID=208336 RepID=A0ABV0MN59_9TELE
MEASVTRRVEGPSWMRLIGSLSSPSTNSDRQLAFCRGSEERERDDPKRTAHDNFNVRVQQYGQDWITGGMYGAEIHRGPQWEACGERTQGMVSATFQHSLVETSQLGKSQMEEELSFLSNGATELSSQQRRSHSRVSSLTRAFDSDGHRDGVEMDHKIKERDDGTSWDKSALMSIQRELSEFSYQQNFNSHHFHRAGLLSSRDANFYSSEAETMAQISHSFMRSSQTKHSMSSQVNCSSNFFIHSEFSPFRLWRDYNRFPFQPAEAAGFMHYSEFPKWYQTPMYNELYLENQAHSHHRDFRHQKNHLGLPVPLTAPRSISTSSQLQRASAVEKRCESELTVHHPHRKWTQRLGTNKLPSHRPSTASPSTEMSRRVRDTISSVKALQQKVKMMSEHNMTNQQGVFSGNDSWVHLSNNALTVDTNVVSSNTANPFRIGTKPLMFRVKDNTNRGSSFTKSVKPHFHKNFGEDFLMGLTLEGRSDKTEEDQEIIRRNAGTPLNRFSAISESATFLSPSSSQDYSNSIPHLRPYSRRSMAVDDDESHSVISNMSEDVESFATSAADLTDMHGLFDNDRPESVCSFSSDVSRSLGKPPTVPPKSEKALRRAQRLTSRRIKKELSKAATESPTGVKEVSSFLSSPSSSNEVCSSNHHAVASPHFSPPVAFALAPTIGSSMPSSHKDHKSSHCSLHASPHATGPISIPSSSPCAASAFSLHACSPASKPAVLQTVAHVSSSPTLHHVNHPATPVTQYHVESTNYPQSYPATQRKVLQDLGSGQYFVVDVPVQVKTKTFFDPETGKYVQLNVRQTGQNISQPQLQQVYQQPKVQPQMQIKQQQPISSIVSGVSKPLRFYQNSHSPSQNYQTAVANSVHPSSSSIPATLHQNQQVLRENHSYGNPVPGVDQNSEGHRYSPEKTPYMDTVNDITKTYNLVNSPADACNPSLECDTNSQLSRSSVCENDLSANSECRPRDIIAISELEDFMEVCDCLCRNRVKMNMLLLLRVVSGMGAGGIHCLIEVCHTLNVTVTPGPLVLVAEKENLTLSCLVSERKWSSSVLILRWIFSPLTHPTLRPLVPTTSPTTLSPSQFLIVRIGIKKIQQYGNYSRCFPQPKFRLFDDAAGEVYRLFIANVTGMDQGFYSCRVQEIRKYRNTWRSSSNGTSTTQLAGNRKSDLASFSTIA